MVTQALAHIDGTRLPATPLAAGMSPLDAAPSEGLRRRDFFEAVVDRLRLHLPTPLADFRHKASMGQVKVFYGNERVHYEVWTDGQRGQLEIGLHFEDGPVSTAAFLTFFDARIVELKHDLGPELELERWTASWGHLFEIWPLTRLDDALADRAARRLATVIAAVQPLVDDAAVPPERAAQPAE
ncbi:MAG: hypothetical protein M3Q10_16325, partial [Chloroflexota bacterium]|nr:hypothetical protein [Chloroflexota bacterium]